MIIRAAALVIFMYTCIYRERELWKYFVQLHLLGCIYIVTCIGVVGVFAINITTKLPQNVTY